jgi:hypothetical protein
LIGLQFWISVDPADVILNVTEPKASAAGIKRLGRLAFLSKPKYIGSTRESYSPTIIDFDNTAHDIFDVPDIYEDDNSSHDLQFNYSGDGLNVVGGIYYYDGESCGQFEAILGFLGRAAFGTPGLTREVSGCNKIESTAIYAWGFTILLNNYRSLSVLDIQMKKNKQLSKMVWYLIMFILNQLGSLAMSAQLVT